MNAAAKCQRAMCANNIYSRVELRKRMARMNNDQNNPLYIEFGRCVSDMDESGAQYPKESMCKMISQIDKQKQPHSPQTRYSSPKKKQPTKKAKKTKTKTPTPKASKAKTQKGKNCEDGKEISLKTGNCVNKCINGTVRNIDTGRCRKM